MVRSIVPTSTPLSLSGFEALNAMLFFFFSSLPYLATKSSSQEIRELIKLSVDKVFELLASFMTILLGLYSVGKHLIILFTFSLFEKIFSRAPNVFTISINLIYIE